LSLAEYLGISPAFIDTTILGGSSFMFHVAHAQAAFQLGLCKVAVIAYGLDPAHDRPPSGLGARIQSL
jgi:hypothetical protein